MLTSAMNEFEAFRISAGFEDIGLDPLKSLFLHAHNFNNTQNDNHTKMICSPYSPFLLDEFPFHRRHGRKHHMMARRRGFYSAPNVDLSDESDKVDVSVDVPGIKKKDLKVSVENDQLEIEGSRRVSTPHGASTRKFSRSFALDVDSLDLSKMSANLTDGVLRVSIPKKERPAPLEIDITEGETEVEVEDVISIDDEDEKLEAEEEQEEKKPSASLKEPPSEESVATKDTEEKTD